MSAIGYPDWQRLVNWDGPVLWNFPSQTINAQVASPVMDVSRYGYLGGNILATGSPVAVTVNWYADLALTTFLGFRLMTFKGNAGFPVCLRIPNQGSFCQVLANTDNQAGRNFSAMIAPTNRIFPLELVTFDAMLLNTTITNLANGATATNTIGTLHSGPALMWMSSAAGVKATVGLFEWEAVTGYQEFSEVLYPGGDQLQPIVLPPKALQTRLTNTSGALASYSLAIIASMSGSS